jgi:hypothetical protein
MKTTQLLAIAAFAGVAAFSAHADEADGSQYPLKFNSTRAAADVKAEAMNPVRITNGGTGFVGVTMSNVSAQAVRDEAIQSARRGETTRGEM